MGEVTCMGGGGALHGAGKGDSSGVRGKPFLSRGVNGVRMQTRLINSFGPRGY